MTGETAVIDERVRPFSSGGQFSNWSSSNCDRCINGGDRQLLPTCEIELAIGEAYLGDGTVSVEVARQVGYFDNKGYYVWPCGMYAELTG